MSEAEEKKQDGGQTVLPPKSASHASALYLSASGCPSLVSCTTSAGDLDKLATTGSASTERLPAASSEAFAVGTYRCVTCPICLEVFTLANPAVLVSCEHSFHLQCLESWRQRSSTCPVCLKALSVDEGLLMSAANTRRARRRQRKCAACEPVLLLPGMVSIPPSAPQQDEASTSLRIDEEPQDTAAVESPMNRPDDDEAPRSPPWCSCFWWWDL